MTPESSFYAGSLHCLRTSPLFGQLDEGTLAYILKHCCRETWKHRRLLPLSETKDRFHILLLGRVRLGCSNLESGRMITLFLHGSGDAFCLLNLLDGQPHDIMVEPLDDVALLSMPMPEVRRWIEEHPAFNRTLLPYIGQQMGALANLAADLALHDTEARLARLILRYIDSALPEHVKPRLINDLSHESLAEMIGSVRVVVNRQLQHWKSEGIVDSHRGYLMVKKLNELVQKAELRLARLPSISRLQHGNRPAIER